MNYMTGILIGVILCMGIAIYFCHSDNKRLRKTLTRIESKWVRYQLVIRWCAAYDIDAMDLDAFVECRLTKRMVLWKEKAGNDPLIIENFREYLKDSQV